MIKGESRLVSTGKDIVFNLRRDNFKAFELLVEKWTCPNCGNDKTTTAYDIDGKRYCIECKPKQNDI